ncbi:META domain-containing protein [Fusobacterium sp. THCT1E2]
MKKIFIFLATLMLLAGCSSTPVKVEVPVEVSLENVAGNEYVLTNLFAENNLTIGFDKDGRIFGFAGINRFFGKADINDGNINIGALATTRMGGPRDKMIVEDQYLTFLKNVKTIKKDGNNLILTNDKADEMIFIKK